MLEYHAFNPIAFEIGPVKVHWYGIMYLIGFAAGWWLARLRAARPGSTWKASDVDDFVFYAMLGVILGGRIGYVLFYGLSYWENDPWYPLKIWEGGMSFHGGLLGVLAAIAIFAVRQGRNIADVFDFGAPLPGIGLMAGRIGNFINGELWGKPTNVALGIQGRRAGAACLAALRGLSRRTRAVRGAVVVYLATAPAAGSFRAFSRHLRNCALADRVRARAG
jgi:phosphatidylglycerol:prolipoprotein diacylglycerol transferase